MIANGMAIGCHTHTHPVLSQLTVDDQYKELKTVKETLQARLSVPANVLAYPVGKKTTFTQETQQVLHQLGYRAAFSYYGGINLPGTTMPFDIRRNSVDAGLPLSRLRMQLALASVTGSYWF
jgi:peptidoglycan/xylan/chitin deacetylase (PgdA/CDA1 family)